MTNKKPSFGRKNFTFGCNMIWVVARTHPFYMCVPAIALWLRRTPSWTDDGLCFDLFMVAKSPHLGGDSAMLCVLADRGVGCDGIYCSSTDLCTPFFTVDFRPTTVLKNIAVSKESLRFTRLLQYIVCCCRFYNTMSCRVPQAFTSFVLRVKGRTLVMECAHPWKRLQD